MALAHDLGHTPFGHTGEDALDALMAPHGGFDHNAQAIRIVTQLERHYAEFDGLNLTWETLEGIAKHNGPVTGDLPYALAEYDARHALELHTHASAEAQVAALADDIAYNNHDLHDGLRARAFHRGGDRGPADRRRGLCRGRPEISRHSMPTAAATRRCAVSSGRWSADVIDTSRATLDAAAPQDAQTVRELGCPVISFSDGMWAAIREIRTFLFTRMYRAPSVMEQRTRVTAVVHDLFPIYLERPDLLPQRWQRRDRGGGRHDRAGASRGRLHRGHDGPLRAPEPRAADGRRRAARRDLRADTRRSSPARAALYPLGQHSPYPKGSDPMATGVESGLAPVLGFALVGALGVGSQWLAWRLRMPAIVLMLAAGLLVGPGLGLLDPARDFGKLVEPMIAIAVAIILFEGGLTLNLHSLAMRPRACGGWSSSARRSAGRLRPPRCTGSRASRGRPPRSSAAS